MSGGDFGAFKQGHQIEAERRRGRADMTNTAAASADFVRRAGITANGSAFGSRFNAIALVHRGVCCVSDLSGKRGGDSNCRRVWRDARARRVNGCHPA